MSFAILVECQLSFFNLSKKAENTFSVDGFHNWKDATRCFRKHESSLAHKEAAMKWLHYTKSQSVGAQLSKQLRDDQIQARKCLMLMISTLQFIGR